MNLPVTAIINKLGHLEIGGCDTVVLAEKYGTPLYVIDENTLAQRAADYRDTLKQFYPNSLVVFASKALSNVGILKIFSEEGFGVDVSSGGELFTAIKANVDMKKVYYHGSNKSREEIETAVYRGVGRIVVDSIDELNFLGTILQGKGKKADILFRVNPGIEAHTHDYIKTGQTDSKFGIAKDKVAEAVRTASGTKNINFVGLHAHIGSQILDTKGFLEEVSVLLSLSKKIKDELNVEVKEINIGGGVGIQYTNEKPLDIKIFVKVIAEKMKETSKKLGLSLPKLIIEPGRSLVGQAGVTLYSVGNTKNIPGMRKYVSVDGGMGDNIRPSLYQAKYAAVLANKMNDKGKEKVTIAGRYCESGDILIKDISLPKMERGDVIAVLGTGAYCYSMASNYNRVPRPAMVMVSHGNAKLILKRETYEDLLQFDMI